MKIVRNALLAATLIIISCAYAMADSLPAVPPLPPDFQSIKISTPDQAVPAETNQLLGEWEGVWEVRSPRGGMFSQARRAKMIVYEVTANKIKYLWGVGFNPETKAEPRWSKYESDLKEWAGKKIFGHEAPPDPSRGSYTTKFFLEDSTIVGEVGLASIKMKRVK